MGNKAMRSKKKCKVGNNGNGIVAYGSKERKK